MVFENVRKVLACRSPVLGCHIYQCASCGHVELIPDSCKSRFVSSELVEGCPTCGKHATDLWAKQVLNNLYASWGVEEKVEISSYITMKVYTFIGRLIRHIPDKYFPMIRYVDMFGASPEIVF
jgi:hypothetical protein